MDGEIVLTLLALTLGLAAFFGIVRRTDRRRGSWDRRDGMIRGNGGRRASDRGPSPDVRSAEAPKSEPAPSIAMRQPSIAAAK